MSRPSHYPHDGGRPSIFIDGAGGSVHQRQSFAPAPASSSGGAAARLQAKRQELDGLLMLKEQSARLARDIERLGENVDALVEGGEAVAAVMQSWSGVFRAMQIAQGSLAARARSSAAEEEDASRVVPETLVRLPLDGAGTGSQEAPLHEAEEAT